ncbi:MAG TPA: M55 family metallopeptidase [Gemmatimonadaceae bacterium]|nr:M55 family metallopeptidase [Gemmatimonadaceae bacterium]
MRFASPRQRPRQGARPSVGLALVVVLLAGLPLAVEAQQAPKKKVYISVDLEGIAGVVANTQTSPSGQNYDWARRQMIAETNAAIEGAFAGGATEVVVNDSHGPQTNLRPDELDRRATLITGQPKPLGMTQGLDSTFDAAVYIGYHAPGSTADAVHGHTFSGALKVVRLNGKEVGEYGLNAMVAGYWGVPVVFISGDKAAVEMAGAFIPGVDGLAVKEGIGFYAARTMHPLEARDRIRDGVRAALVKRIARAPVKLASPITLEIELDALSHADQVALVPGIRRNGRTVSYTSPDPLTIYKVARLAMALSRD